MQLDAYKSHSHQIYGYLPVTVQNGTGIDVGTSNGSGGITGPSGGAETRGINTALTPMLFL